MYSNNIFPIADLPRGLGLNLLCNTQLHKSLELSYFLVEINEKPPIFLFRVCIPVNQNRHKTENKSVSQVHGVPKGGQKEKKLSGFGAYIFGIGIPRGFTL